MLLRYVGAQREHVLGILEGLDEAALRKPLLPSGWSCLGLVQHLALDVERFWFQAVIAGEQAAIDALADTPPQRLATRPGRFCQGDLRPLS